MTDNLDYKALFLQSEDGRKQAEERRKQAEEGRRQADEGRRQAEEGRRQADERRRQADERRRQADERRRQAEEKTRKTNFVELLRFSYKFLSQPLRVETPARSTAGKIPLPTDKYCPTRLEHWDNCSTLLSEIYRSVYKHLQRTPETGGELQLFSSLHELEGLGRRLCRDPMSSEKELEAYERFAVEEHVHDIIAELCQLPAARKEFDLGDGIQFISHTNSLKENDTESEASQDATQADSSQLSSVQNPRPDQFCINRVKGNTLTVLTSVEYKPPHKLLVADLRIGLRPMDLWKEMVKSNKTPTETDAKLTYNAERLVCSALVQEYHVMIQQGLEFSYVTNGLARILLRVPRDDPSKLYYFLCDPESELNADAEDSFQELKTSIARTLCLCLMGFRSSVRDQEWRNFIKGKLHIWKTNFDHIRYQIAHPELPQTLPNSDSTSQQYSSQDSGSSYKPSSSPPGPTPAVARRKSRTRCALSGVQHRFKSPNTSGSDSNQPTNYPNTRNGRKRRYSQITSSPPAQGSSRQHESRNNPGNQACYRDAKFCTQRCLFGLQSGGALDDCCPNLMLHRQSKNYSNHLITSKDLVRLLSEQLDENIDRCIPLEGCGGYGAPFKLTCAIYGYTVIGKGTTSALWKEVSREADVYQILQKVQGSAVPVFLGTIDLSKIYFIHEVEIRHMLVMGWGGESIASMELAPWLRQEIDKSNKEIKALGIIHEDLRADNILWNEELGRALIIDFHRFTMSKSQRSRAVNQR